MLGKLVKYDLQFGAKKYAFVAALSAALVLLAALVRLSELPAVLGIVLFLAILASMVFAVMYYVISVWHLHSQLCGRESYFSYSLPVSHHTLLVSKLICILFWGVVVSALLVIFWVVGVEFIFLRPEGQSLISEVQAFFRSEIWRELSRYSVPIVVLMIVAMLQQVIYMGLCVSLVNVPALKERSLGAPAGIVAYLFGAQLIAAGQFFLLWVYGRIRGLENLDIMTDPAGGMEMLIFMILFNAAITVVCYAVTAWLIGKKRSI